MIQGVAPALVLLHGFTQTRQSWRRTVRVLGAGRYRALVPDLPGHGQATLRTPSFDAVHGLRARPGAGAVHAGRLQPGRPDRPARGAPAAAAARAAHPRRREPGPRRRGEREQRRGADDALADRIEAIGVEAFAAEWGAQPLFAGQPARVAAAANADRLRNTARGLARALRGLGTGRMEPLWDRLPEFDHPRHADRGRARREVPRDRGADARAPTGRPAGRRARTPGTRPTSSSPRRSPTSWGRPLRPPPRNRRSRSCRPGRRTRLHRAGSGRCRGSRRARRAR